jgi:cytosine/adenosine deaminase-related metal-dependent hydrolase
VAAAPMTEGGSSSFMDKATLEKNFFGLLSAIETCFKDKRILPGLILLYAHIDIVASLNRPASKDEGTRQDFKDWVNQYLLPSSGLSCSADDLYAARCGLVHSYIAEARLTRSGDAKLIFYAWGTAEGEKLRERVTKVGLDSKAVAVHVDELLKAFVAGLDRFIEDLSRDSQKEQLVYERARKFFANIPIEAIG